MNSDLLFDQDDKDTISREHPIAEYVRSKVNNDRVYDYKNDRDSRHGHNNDDNMMANIDNRYDSINSLSSEASGKESFSTNENSIRTMIKQSSIDSPQRNFRSPYSSKGTTMKSTMLTSIVLKFTTVSEGCNEAPSFQVTTKGAKIGSGSSNEVYVPSDLRLASENHASIKYIKGEFYILDGGYDHAASVRIGVGTAHKMHWYLDAGARFSAGNSVFLSEGVDSEGRLTLKCIEGPLKNETRMVTKEGASFGRSSENSISVPDRELSRRHSKIEYDEKVGKFIVCDVGSTNGTYMQLVGPYGGLFKLSLNDHILVGRTGFSINRYDYGLSEEIGFRPAMEDACTIVQHLNINPFNGIGLAPQSFFGVFDGHGGYTASHYLAQNLHVNIADALLAESADIFKLFEGLKPSEYQNFIEHPILLKNLDEIVSKTLVTTFLKTDAEFIDSSSSSHHGSTATTALILGPRLYVANVGDSRVLLCRNFKPHPMTCDHKPAREDESKRIRDAGGFVINNRVMGELAVSRAFGDSEFKKGIQGIVEQDIESGSHQLREGVEIDTKNWDQPLIIAEPDIEITTITESDQFLLLACDGLFDVFSPEDIVNFVKANMEDHRDSQRCCQNLTHEAIRKRNSRDNVSVILIILNPWY